VPEGAIAKGALRGPRWQRLFPDIYVIKEAYQPSDHRMWCDAVALNLGPGCAINGYGAGFLWSVDLLPERAPVSISVPPETHAPASDEISEMVRA